MTIVSIVLGWLVAGRVLRPLRTMTAIARQISESNLNGRLALSGPSDELKDLADTIDGLLGRLETHVAEQRRFAANASHELRTPLAITQTLPDVARKGPNREVGELVDRLHEVNTRAIDLSEALLLLSRADQKAFAAETVDLSLMVEEAIETLLPVAEKHGVTIVGSGEITPALGSETLLLQLATNLVHNAIVYDQGSVRQCGAHGREHRRHTHPPRWFPRWWNRFSAAPSEYALTKQGAGLGLAIVRSITQAHEGSLILSPRKAGDSASQCGYPPHPHTLAHDDLSRMPSPASDWGPTCERFVSQSVGAVHAGRPGPRPR